MISSQVVHEMTKQQLKQKLLNFDNALVALNQLDHSILTSSQSKLIDEAATLCLAFSNMRGDLS